MSQPKVVVVTAASESLYRQCTELEMVHAILRKPFDVDQLEEQLRMIVGQVPRSQKKVRAGGTETPMSRSG